MKRMLPSSLSAVLLFCGMTAALSAAVPVAENGQTKAVIVSNGQSKMAGELKKYLDKITGADIPVREKNESGSPDSVIELKIAPVEGLTTDDRGKQGYQLKTSGRLFTLISPTEEGLSNAVYGFLNDYLGVRFYSPKVEVVPSNPNLTIPDIDQTIKPSFATRGYIYSPGYSHDNWRKNRGGSMLDGYNLSATHSFYTYMPPAKYFKDHPEWYPMNAEGKRFHDGSMPLCGTNPELAKELAKQLVIAYDKKNPQDVHAKSFLPVAQGDGFTQCLCPECRKLVKEEGSESAPYILMLNRALEEANKTRPNLKVVTFAYFDTLFPPKKMAVHPHLYIHIVNSSIGQYMGGDNINCLDDSPGQDQYFRAMKAWGKKFNGQTDRMSMYEWDTPFVSNILFIEWPNILAHCKDIKTYYKLGCIYNINIEGGGRVAWQDLCHWVWMNLFWNAEQDEIALVKDFLNGYYGPKAAPFLLAYLQYIEQVRKDTWYPATTVRWSGWGEYIVTKFYTPDVRKNMKFFLTEAMKAASQEKDPEYLKRVTKTYNALIPQMYLTSETVKPFDFARDPATGKTWFLRGGNPEYIQYIPPILDATMELRFQPWSNQTTRARYSATYGSPVEQLDSGRLQLSVAPGIRGSIVSLKKNGTELLANKDGAGYTDKLPGGAAWTVQKTEPGSLALQACIDPHAWAGGYGTLLYNRNIELKNDVVRITREFEQKPKSAIRLSKNAVFSSAWSFVMPDPENAVVVVEAEGLRKVIPLAAFSHAGNGAYDMVNLAKAAGSDVQDMALMVPEAADASGFMDIPLKDAKGNLVIRYGRGDGIALEIASSVEGWDKLRIAPDAKKNELVITMTGVRHPGIENADAKKIALPAFSLRVLDAAKTSAKPAAAAAPVPEKTVAPKIRITGENTGINELDGAEMIWIPAGVFKRGAAEGHLLPENIHADWSPRDAHPVRDIELDGFWIYKYPVTYGQYKAVMEKAGKKVNPVGAGKPYTDKSMVILSWAESAEYAKLVGASLPTEAQWERAARGKHKDAVRYPWGNTWQPDRVACQELLEKGDAFYSDTFEIGQFPKGASTFGVEDMIGGSFEWVNDWYDAGYYAVSPAKNPQGPATGRFKVLKGGDSNYGADFAQIGFRMIAPPDVRGWCKTQFRCVINAPGPDAEKKAEVKKEKRLIDDPETAVRIGTTGEENLIPVHFDRWSFVPGLSGNWQNAIPEGAKEFRLPPRGIDLDTLTGKVNPLESDGVVYGEFESDEDGFAYLGAGADYWFSAWCNGVFCATTFPEGQYFSDIRPSHHPFVVPVRKGKNLLAVHVRRGSATWGFDCGNVSGEPALPVLRERPWLLFPSPEGMTIGFRTSGRVGAGVRIRPADGSGPERIVWDERGKQICRRSLHRIPVSGLKPDTEYEYGIVLLDPENPAEAVAPLNGGSGTFRTPGLENSRFRFFFTADLQCSPEEQQKTLKALIKASKAEDCDFFVFGGDIGNTFEGPSVVNGLFPVIPDGKPIVYLRGNHEMHGKDADSYPLYFSWPDGKSYGMFRWGDTAFLVLDCWEDAPAPALNKSACKYNLDREIWREQTEFIRRTVVSPEWTSARRRIVLAHGAPMASGGYLASNLAAAVDPFFAGKDPFSRLDLWLGGHVHIYMRMTPGSNDIFGFKQMPIPVRPRKDYFFQTMIVTGPAFPRELYQASAFRVDADAEKLLVRAYAPDGTCFDEVEIAVGGTATPKKELKKW